METKKLYAVAVYDDTCNDMAHEFGIYGKGDYSWIDESLNGGCNAEYNMTLEEAEEVKADFERVIKEKNLEWASVDIDCFEFTYDVEFNNDENTTIKIGYKYDVIDDDLGDVIEANQIEMTCDENMNYIISINDYVKLQEVAPAAMDDFYVIND